MNVVWSGTTSRPTTTTTGRSGRGTYIQANAYAANAAIIIGMIVAGTEMNEAVDEAWPRFDWSRTVV